MFKQIAKVVVFSIILLPLIGSFPFFFSYAIDNYRAYIFGKQIKNMELPVKNEIMSFYYRVKRGGSHDACMYEATVVFAIYEDNANEKIRNFIYQQNFSPARRSYNDDVDISIFESDRIVVINISDGPFTSNFNLACW